MKPIDKYMAHMSKKKDKKGAKSLPDNLKGMNKKEL
jgi:hypothetical protein